MNVSLSHQCVFVCVVVVFSLSLSLLPTLFKRKKKTEVFPFPKNNKISTRQLIQCIAQKIMGILIKEHLHMVFEDCICFMSLLQRNAKLSQFFFLIFSDSNVLCIIYCVEKATESSSSKRWHDKTSKRQTTRISLSLTSWKTAGILRGEEIKGA